MSVNSVHGCLHFEGAFQDICEMHNINRDVIVHYTYNGAGEFNIRMYYEENVEVNYGGQQEVAPNPHGEFAWLNDITMPMSFGKQCLVLLITLSFSHGQDTYRLEVVRR